MNCGCVSDGCKLGPELLRAVLIMAAASLVGLGLNALRSNPMPLLAANGPGALVEKAPRISIEELKRQQAEQKLVLLIDVRNEHAFNVGHAAIAMHAPATEFMQYYQKLLLGPRIRGSHLTVLMCESDHCRLADEVAKILHDLGHTNVRVLTNGWLAYQASGLEVEAEAKKSK